MKKAICILILIVLVCLLHFGIIPKVEQEYDWVFWSLFAVWCITFVIGVITSFIDYIINFIAQLDNSQVSFVFCMIMSFLGYFLLYNVIFGDMCRNALGNLTTWGRIIIISTGVVSFFSLWILTFGSEKKLS